MKSIRIYRQYKLTHYMFFRLKGVCREEGWVRPWKASLKKKLEKRITKYQNPIKLTRITTKKFTNWPKLMDFDVETPSPHFFSLKSAPTHTNNSGYHPVQAPKIYLIWWCQCHSKLVIKYILVAHFMVTLNWSSIYHVYKITFTRASKAINNLLNYI